MVLVQESALKKTFYPRFQKGELPEVIEEKTLASAVPLPLIQVLKQVGLVSSTSEATRLLAQGG